ncbi:CPBP family intramembrane glutamic endopeptidase [Oceanomicrobium pacificus]|uniref:CPBP family intramembrane metalloprotease n=1 Tax=Oceanomicrobium pacificus TaxID=2692916 RepID=A0A6B0TN35_9RHOB|nr:type II CAAX endopeptidase family protein [Oceanomicrobium pacificus]MXU65947.1 CPBP family intramembrane metalloprotease [Oceanomicrobium pacificus]
MTNVIRNWVNKRPIIFAIFLIFVYFVFLSIPSLFSSGAFGKDETKSANSIDLGDLPFEFFLAASIVAIIGLVGWNKKARLTSAPDWSGIWAPIVFAVYIASILIPGLMAAAGSGAQISDLIASIPWEKFILFMLLIGIFEESLFRGAVFRGFEAGIGPIFAVIISSVLFGSMHFVNWIAGQALESTVEQAIQAAMLGFAFATISLRMNSIWFGVAAHALFDGVVDFNGQVLATAADAVAPSDPSIGQPVPPVEPASDTAALATGALNLLLRHFELVLGSIVLWSWWRRQRRNQSL